MARALQRNFKDAFRAGVFALLACAMTGCVTPEEIRQANERQCLGYGFQPATSDFARCLQQESLAERYYLGDPHPHYTWW